MGKTAAAAENKKHRHEIASVLCLHGGDKRYRVLKGSAGSGKSVNVAQDFVLKLTDARS